MTNLTLTKPVALHILHKDVNRSKKKMVRLLLLKPGATAVIEGLIRAAADTLGAGYCFCGDASLAR